MASLSDDTLHKILQQIQIQSLQSQKSLSSVNAQLQMKAREKRILDLTTQQLEGIPKDGGEVRMYKSVGKMFMLQPRSEVSAEHKSQDKILKDDLINLSKKAKYLEKQVTDANNQWRDIVRLPITLQPREAHRSVLGKADVGGM